MKNPMVIGLYGESNIGKTTLIKKIIKRLIKEKFKVATVKITDREIGIDTKGKDTWKHSQSGSQLVVFSTPIETDYLLKKKQSINEILNNINKIGDFDFVIVEGANDKIIPKIRLGTIKERNNTIYTYRGDFEELIKIIKKGDKE